MKKENIIIPIVLILISIIGLVFLLRGTKAMAPAPENTNGGAESEKAGTPVSITKQEIKETNWNGSVPVIVGSSPVAMEAKKFIEQEVSAFRERADKEVPQVAKEFAKYGGPTPVYSLDITADYIKGTKTESIVLSEYQFTAGANGMTTYKVLTDSLATGKDLSLYDIIQPDHRDAFTALVKQKLLAWIPDGRSAPLTFPDEVNKLTFDSFSNWSMDNQNLTIYFDKYAVGPGVLGPVAFPIPLTEIGNFLDSQFAL